jgi:hypothetical protein
MIEKPDVPDRLPRVSVPCTPGRVGSIGAADRLAGLWSEEQA